METQTDDYTLTMLEVCEKLSKSKKTLGRYVRRRLLHPKLVKSIKGTPEYRFSVSEVQGFKDSQPRQEIPFDSVMGSQEGQSLNQIDFTKETAEQRQEPQPWTETPDKKLQEEKSQEIKEDIKETRQETKVETGKLEQTRQDETTNLIAETIRVLREQLEKKDIQLGAKDRQIDSLLERNREMNVLLKFLQDKYPALEAPKSRRGRKAKAQTAEAVDIEEIRPEAPAETQEPAEAPKPTKEEEAAPASQEAASEEIIEPEEEEKKPNKKAKKGGFWKKLFTPYNLP